MSIDTATRQMWARLTVDPLADPLARHLARHRTVTPNRITSAALVFGLLSAASFATGHLRVGGALILLRYFTDCLDGKVARVQGTSSARGALFDIGSDILCITLAATALCWRLVSDGHLGTGAGLALLGALVVYNWALEHRKHLAGAAGLGSGGAAHTWQPTVPVLREWVQLCRRINMAVVPWVLEVEMVTFGLAPLLLPPGYVASVVVLAAGFYVVAAGVNLRRAWRIAGRAPALAAVDRPRPAVDVVIATRHRPDLLRRAIAAAWDQDYRGQVTIHVVFDGTPPDLTLERVGEQRRVRVLSNDRGPGLAGARNCGILAGEAELVAFCDDDDTWRPEKLQHQVRTLRDSGADTVVSGIEVEYRDHTVVRIPAPGDLALANLVRRRVMEAHPSTVLVRRTALTGPIGLVDENIPGSYGEDFDWIIRAARHGTIAVVPEPLVRVLWGQSLFSRNWQTMVEAIDYGLTKTPEFSADPLALGRLYGRRAFALAALGRRDALTAVVRTLRVSPREKRAYLAAAVALHLVSADRLLDLAHRRGHGI